MCLFAVLTFGKGIEAQENPAGKKQASSDAQKGAVSEKDASAAAGEELQKAIQNPVASLMNVPLQNNTNFSLGSFNHTQDVLNIQPVIPANLTKNLYVQNDFGNSSINAGKKLSIAQVLGQLLLVVDAHIVEMLSASVRALCCDGKNLSIGGDNTSRRCHDFTPLLQSGLNRIRSGQIGRNRICPVGPVSDNGITLVVQVACVFELLITAISVDAFDANLHTRRTRYHNPGFTLSRRTRDKLGFLHIQLPGTEKRVSLSKQELRKTKAQGDHSQERKQLLHCYFLSQPRKSLQNPTEVCRSKTGWPLPDC
jgi:hypothetical protein